MKANELRRALRSAPAPDELGAERRAWGVVRAAYDPASAARPRRLPTRLLVALAVAVALVTAGLTPPGRAVTGWVRETIGIERVPGQPGARPALASLPSPGNLLVVARGSAWTVREDGSKRRLGRYDEATWSPQGLHVALARGPRLVAATPDGAVRWTLTKERRVVAPRWSPSGVRIAYGLGGALRVVHGDGEPDRLVAQRARPRTWSWLPDDARNVLAFAHGRTLVVVDVDEERALWRTETAAETKETAWSADGRYLLARTRLGVEVYGRRGRFAGHVRAEGEIAVAPAPTGRRVAVVARSGGRSRVVLVDLVRLGRHGKLLFSGAGRFDRVEWSPDGRWLLVSWPSADQWVFLRVPELRRIRAVSNIAREFDPGGTGRAHAPRVSGWCCPPVAP